MSGYPAGTGDGNGLDSLFQQLRESNSQTRQIHLEPSSSYYSNNNNSSNGYFGQPQYSQPQPHGYQQPSATSQIPTPTPTGPPPHHASAIISPVETPPQIRAPAMSGANSSDHRTSNLLNLLKFSQPSGSPATQPAPIGTPPTSREPATSYGGPNTSGPIGGNSQRGPSGSDLLATLMGTTPSKPAQNPSTSFNPVVPSAHQAFEAPRPPPSDDTQRYLLQLLNQPKAPSPPQLRHAPSPPQQKSHKVLTPPSKASSQGEDVEELTQALNDTSIETNMMGAAATESLPTFGKENNRSSVANSGPGLFTYVNPFDQLAASSPRNQTPKGEKIAPSHSPANPIQILKPPKRKIDNTSNTSSPAHSKQKLELASRESSGPPTPLPDGRTPVEALIGIGSTKETVHHAVEEVGSKVDKQVQDAIVRAEHDHPGSYGFDVEEQIKRMLVAETERESQQATKVARSKEIEEDLKNMLDAETEREFQQTAQIAARSIKKELEKKENTGALDSLPTPVAESVKEIIDDTAQGHIADSWESADAEDSQNKDDEDSAIKVFNFPMRPWTSITIKETDDVRPTFRDEAVMDIARLKKEFDQVDRTLVTASNNFIVYGMSKNGGVRIIRQTDGQDAKLFTETHDRIFSVVTSSSSADLKEAIIGTGISGTVYWALVKDGEGDNIEESHPEMYGFALPPLHSQETETPGGVLKTRARKSSNHPDFFAVGRGKFINIIWPSVIMKQSYLKDGKDRLVDAERYLSKHSLKINTGKAGKDFAFSEDDSTIVSLDKAGRVKFWDVRYLTKTDILGAPAHHNNVEIKEPLVTFNTTPASERAWPTSVILVDKQRPYQRGGALRYLIVGMKQNHTLQLWDLALQKPVQEINLPHTKESDAVCSVVYHAASGIIVVGHPTRNSIYFLHLSAPKYVLPKNVTQAEYIEKFVAGDAAFPKPESTAVISGMREYSFANKGTLRSLDILQTPNSATSGDPSTLFELYTMHSKGVTCLTIKQADLGWNAENKVINGFTADEVGAITIDTLKEVPASVAPEITDSAALSSAPTRIVPRPVQPAQPKEAAVAKKAVETPRVEDKTADKKEATPQVAATSQQASGPEKSEKKKRRKNTVDASTVHPQQTAGSSKTPILDPSSMTRNGFIKPTNNTAAESSSTMNSSPQVNDSSLKSIEKLFNGSLEKVLKEFKIDRSVQDATFASNQESVLRLVSSTLTENIEVSLGKIVSKSIQATVLPAVTDTASKAIHEQLGSKLNSHFTNNLPKELQKHLPDALSKALQQPQLLKLMSDTLAKSVAFKVEEEFYSLMSKTVLPQFTDLTIQTTQKVAADIERQSAQRVNVLKEQREADSIKIERLTQLVTSLSETVSSMAAAQTEFQAQSLKVQQQASVSGRQASGGHSEGQTQHSSISRSSTALTAPVERAEVVDQQFQEMMEGITTAMSKGEYENAVIQWLQTQREQEFFTKYFAQFNPEFIRDLSPLLLLSLGATISLDFEDQYLRQRVAWLEAILNSFSIHVTHGTLVS